MKFYKLTDSFNLNEIIKETETRKWFIYSYGEEKWVTSSIMTRYQWSDDIFYNKYVTISEEECKHVIAKNRALLIWQLKLAQEIAGKAHEGQVDKGGTPYLEHLLFIAKRLNSLEHKVVAMLHDIIEDSAFTADRLLSLGFSKRIIYTVELLTKNKNKTYEDYLKSIKTDHNACLVKIEDLKHNLDLSRIKNPTQKDFDRMNKYEKALHFLEN